MKATLIKGACVLLAFTFLAGCPEEDDSGDEPKKEAKKDDDKDEDKDKDPEPEPKPEPTAVDLQPATDNPAGVTKPAVVARVKSEIDGKDPGDAAGSALVGIGAKASFTVPTDWAKKVSGATSTAMKSDEKARFATAALGGADPATKANDVAAAMSLTDCEWGTAESATVGKDKLAATVADGVCLAGTEAVRTAFVAIAEQDAIAVGGWHDQGGDPAPVFEAFRSCKKAVGGGDPSGIAACCQALQQNSVSAPPQQKGAYLAALGACNALRSNPQGRAALGQVRALLAGANVPAPCQ